MDLSNYTLEVRGLSVAFKTKTELVHAVKDVSFVASSKSAIGLWGHSGCGKTTIMKVLMGLVIDEPGWIVGTAYFQGEQVSPCIGKYIDHHDNGTVYKDTVGFHRNHRKVLKPYLGTRWRTTFQEPVYSFDFDTPVKSQIEIIMKHFSKQSSIPVVQLQLEFEDRLSRLGLTLQEFGSRRNLEFSGGECQRIMLALNLAGNPELLLADEPTTAMDSITRAIANQIIKEQVKLSNMVVVISSHDKDELKEMTDTVVVLCKGRIVEIINSSLLNNDNVEVVHPYTRKLWYAPKVEDKDNIEQETDSNNPRNGCPFVNECPTAMLDNKLHHKCASQLPPYFKISDNHFNACWVQQNHQICEGSEFFL